MRAFNCALIFSSNYKCLRNIDIDKIFLSTRKFNFKNSSLIKGAKTLKFSMSFDN